MAERTDYTALQAFSAAGWENDRSRHVDELAAALAHTINAARAMPQQVTRGQVDLGRAATEIRSQLREQLELENPFVTARTRPGTLDIVHELDALRHDCDYDPEGDSPLEALIAYKDGLEDFLLSFDR